MTRGFPALLAALAGAAVAVAGCSSAGSSSTGDTSASAPSTSSAPTTSVPPSTPQTTVTVSPTVTSTPSSTPASSSAAGDAGNSACGNGALTISASDGNGASGHNRYVLLFHNVSASTCTLHGYPGLDALAASGSLLAHAKRVPMGFMGGSRKGEPTVRLAPGGYASAIVEFATVQQGTGNACDVQSAKIAVTAANTTRSVILNRSVTACSLQIHPTVPGRSGDLI
jgi:Protein of unknown function (DUF4232)